MRFADGLAGTPRRAALLALGILVGSLVLTGATLHRLVAAAMLRELESEVRTSVALYREILRNEGRAALVDAVDRTTARGVDVFRLDALYGADGARLAGRGPEQVPAAAGWRDVGIDAAGAGAVARYRSLTAPAEPLDAVDAIGAAGPAEALTLVVGRDARTIERVLRALTLYLALAGLVVTTVCLGIARALARRTRGRLARMAAVLDRVAHGELGARLDVRTGDDSVDGVSVRINGHLDELRRLVFGTRDTVAAIAHDLRTPLNRAGLRLQEAAAGLHADERRLALVEAAGEELDALGKVFDTILRIGRIRAEDGRGSIEAFRADELVDEVAEIYAPVLEAAGQRLLADACGVAAVRGDRRMVRQMLVNLVENAVRHCPAGSTVRLESCPSPAGGTVLAVVDDGPGIAASECQSVLEPFRRLDASRGTPGSGLGLALVAAIAERHGAALLLGPAHPGLRVTIEFPSATAARDRWHD